MKSWITAAVGLLLMLALITGTMASENARIFMDGTAAYAKGDWPAAIDPQGMSMVTTAAVAMF